MDYMSFNLTYKCDPVCMCVCVCVCVCMYVWLFLHIVYMYTYKAGNQFPLSELQGFLCNYLII